jgi:hypothetical protein
MARGPKGKPAVLHLVEGTRHTTRHGSEEELRDKVENSQQAFGKLEKPESFTEKKGKAWIKFNEDAAKAWDRYIVPAWWLDASKEACAIAYCILWADFMRQGSMFPAAKHGQLRSYAAELGLTDERKRPSNAGKKPKNNLID